MAEGYIAYFDLLGFSQQISREEDFTKEFDKYNDIIATACKPRDIDYLAFSDSVILSAETSDKPTLLKLSQVVASIQYRLMVDLNSPICGSISYGRFNRVVKEGNGMITGRPLLDAIDYEKKQNWIGVMIAPSVISKHPEILEASSLNPGGPDVVGKVVNNVIWSSVFQRWSTIPFEEDAHYEALVITPRDLSCRNCEDLIIQYKKYWDQLRLLRMTAPNVYTQNKYREAELFISSVNQQWSRLITKNAYQKLRTTRVI